MQHPIHKRRGDCSDEAILPPFEKMENNELIFETRALFREWLASKGAMSDGIWLIFSKIDTLKTLSAHEALEEALCFGWIDGQMQSLGDDKYKKYFAYI